MAFGSVRLTRKLVTRTVMPILRAADSGVILKIDEEAARAGTKVEAIQAFETLSAKPL